MSSFIILSEGAAGPSLLNNSEAWPMYFLHEDYSIEVLKIHVYRKVVENNGVFFIYDVLPFCL